MQGIIEGNKENMVKLANDLAKCYVWCFTKESTDKWIDIFANKRFDTIEAIQRDNYENILTDESRAIFLKTFRVQLRENLKHKPHEETAYEKELKKKEGKSHCVRRKVK